MVVKDAKVNTTSGRKSKSSTQSGDLVGKELVDFQNNFNLATSAVPAEPGVLSKPRSQESLSVATEFTKVTKRHRGKKSKEEMANQQQMMGGGQMMQMQMQTGNKQLVANNQQQTPRYAMRAREPQVINSMAPAAEPGMMRQTTSSSSTSSSPPGFQTSDFPSLSVGKFDFPSLGGNKLSESSSEATNQKSLLATPWARVVKSSDVKAVNINCDRVQAPTLPSTSSDIKEEKDKVVVEIEEDNNDEDDKEDEVLEDLTLKQEEEEDE